MKAGDSDQSRVLSRIRLNWLRDSAFRRGSRTEWQRL